MLRLASGTLCLVGIVLAGSACSHAVSGTRGELTVINRTEAEIVVVDADDSQQLRVPACEERTAKDFSINGWTLTSPGRDTFTGGNGFNGPQSFILVTSFPTQSDSRPADLPTCKGLLQPGQS